MELVSRLLGLCLAAEHLLHVYPAVRLLLFWTGYFLYRLRPAEPLLPDIRLPGFSAMGRHSLLIYLLHQPVLYALLVLLPTFL